MDLPSAEGLPLRVNARRTGLATLLLEINILLWKQPAGRRHRGLTSCLKAHWLYEELGSDS